MNRLTKFIDYVFARQRWALHVLFWLMVLAFYALLFGRKNSNYIQTFFFVGLLMPVTIGTTYFLNYYLVPQYLMKERYGFFILYFIYTLIGSLFLEMMISMVTFIVMAEVRIRDMSPASIDLVFLLTSLLMVVFFGVAIKMLLHWRQSREDNERLMREKVEAELKFLKTQLNPHFLFNTLNNLYYLSTEKSDKAPQAVLALSEILDYVLHSGKRVMVPIEEEWRQVENYIALELLRYEDRVDVDKKLLIQQGAYAIGPMILITLIENAFKHGVMPLAGKTWIKLYVNCSQGQIVILISNSWGNSKSGDGIGLQNLRGQLELLYPGCYSLQITTEKQSQFEVNLTLKVKR